MILRAIAGAALALAPSTAAPAVPSVPQQQFPLVHRVTCFLSVGTAFRIGPNTMVSVSHVTDGLGCTIGGQSFKATPEPGDFSIIKTPITKSGGFKINCGGFVKGESYWAIGHAKGALHHTTIHLLGSGLVVESGMAILTGSPTIIPGMSGGPILNTKGEVVGTNNMFSMQFPMSLSRQLKDTSLCKGRVGA